MAAPRLPRRSVLIGALAAATAAPLPSGTAATPRFVAGGLRGETFFLATLEADGTMREAGALAGRAHQVIALRDRGEVIATARRADRWVMIMNPASATTVARLAPHPEYFFAGHAAVSPDGSTLALVEINALDGRGALSLREVGTWRELARIATGGAGPHMALWTEPRVLAVANGGYYDLGSIRSPGGGIGASLAIIDPLAERVAAVVPTGWPYADYSLRHLARAPEGLMVALQRTAESSATTAPLALWRGGDLEPFSGSPPADDPLRGYLSDVAVAGDYVFTSSSRAGAVGAWRRSDRRWVGAIAHPAAGALAVDADGRCAAASETGAILGVECAPLPVAVWQRKAGFGWDNHGTYL